jgi:hypothetical protein
MTRGEINQHWKNYFSVAVKGCIVGGTILVPGVSGGSMAMILGIYGSLISAVSSFRQKKGKNFCFLLVFCIGAMIGMALFSNPISHLIAAYPKPMIYFFMGAVIGGIPMMIRESKIHAFSWRVPAYIFLGLLIVGGISVFPFCSENIRQLTGLLGFLSLFAAGAIAAIALLLPGVSVSYFLLLLGLYDETVTAIQTLHLAFLIPMLLGGIVGIILTAKLLEKAMTRYPRFTYLVILGFILGSVVSIFPGIPTWSELIVCIVSGLSGFSMIYLLSHSGAITVIGKEKRP